MALGAGVMDPPSSDFGATGGGVRLGGWIDGLVDWWMVGGDA